MLKAPIIWIFSKLGNIWQLSKCLILYNVLGLILFVSLFFSIKYSDVLNKATVPFKPNKPRHDEVVVSVFNFSKSIDSNYFNIECRKSAKFFDTITTLCFHLVENDQYISGQIYS